MIIARLQGGLGNQLFQYAAAKALANRLNTSFKAETITSLQKDRLRHIALNDFNAPYELASSKEVKQFLLFPSLYRHSPRFVSLAGKHIYREPHFHYDPAFEHLTDPVFLDGFWQSPRYFESIANMIRSDFTVKSHLTDHLQDQAEKLRSTNSVAVHIRRGDFLNPGAVAYHGILEVGYYTRALDWMNRHVPSISIHYFSDDIAWVQKNLPSANAEYTSARNKSAIEDFYLMTQCRHNIIANSSFSWWPAWLNNNPDKHVIAPAKWFATTANDTSDLLPEEWIKL